MGVNTPTTKLTLALVTAFFSIGFCGNVSATLYNFLTIYRNAIGQVISFFIPYCVALFVGSLVTWPLSSWFRIGRRVTALTGLLVLFLGCVLATSTMSDAQAIAAWVFCGLGIGLTSVSGVLWMVEMKEAAERGRKVVLMFIALSAGNAVAEWINYGFAHVDLPNAGSLRVLLGLQLVVLLFPIFFVWRADESWRWLLQHKQHDRARAILSNYMSTSQADPEFQRAFAALVHHNNQTATSGSLFSRKHTMSSSPQLRPWRRLLLACFLQTMRELNGQPTLTFYLYAASDALAGYQTRYAFISAIPTFTFLFSLIPYALVDRPASGLFSPFGRRGLLMLSAFGLFAMFLLATIVSAGIGGLSVDSWYYGGSSTGLLAACMVLFLFALVFHSLGFRAVTDLYTAEIAASNVRTETMSIAFAWGVAVDVAIAFGAGYGLSGLGTYFFLVWLVLNLVWVGVILLLYPETQGRNLEAIDGLFARRLKILVGNDGDARSGRQVGPGMVEFEMLVESGDGVHGPAAELREELPNSPGRGAQEGGDIGALK